MKTSYRAGFVIMLLVFLISTGSLIKDMVQHQMNLVSNGRVVFEMTHPGFSAEVGWATAPYEGKLVVAPRYYLLLIPIFSLCCAIFCWLMGWVWEDGEALTPTQRNIIGVVAIGIILLFGIWWEHLSWLIWSGAYGSPPSGIRP